MTLINPNKSVSGNEIDAEGNTSINLKTPKRILHFSDGVLEEYSDDEQDTVPPPQQLVDPTSLSWFPWMWYKTWRAGNSTLAAIDYVGEFLAAFFGITTPKYYFELEEYKKLEADKKEMAEQMKGWSEPSNGNLQTAEINKQPKPNEV